MQEKDFIFNFLEVFTTRLARAKLIISDLEFCSTETDLDKNYRVTLFQNMCMTTYRPLIASQKLFKYGQLNLAVSNKVLKEFQRIWKQVFPELGSLQLKLKDFLELGSWNWNLDLKTQAQIAFYDKFRNLHIPIDVQIAAGQSIKWILKSKEVTTQGAENNVFKVQIAMSCPHSESSHDMTQWTLHEYRKLLISLVILKILKLKGYSVEETQYYRLPNKFNFENDLFIIAEYVNKVQIQSDKNKNKCDNTQVVHLNIGNVSVHRPYNSSNKKPRHETLGSFLNEEDDKYDLTQTASSNCSSNSGRTSLALLNYELLIKNPNSEIVFQSEDFGNPNKAQALTVVCYSYARIVTILKTFSRRVKDEIYAPLPSENEINFSTITKSSEELSLLDAILEWPRISDSVFNLTSKEVRISSVLRFQYELSNRFKSFYNKHLVLLQPCAPDSQKMFARIYLLKAILVVLQEAYQLFEHVKSD